MYITFRDASIIKKLTLAYIVFIIIPIVCISLYNYNQQQRKIKNEIISEGQKYVEQIKYNIEKKAQTIESISDSICYNIKILSFLNDKFDFQSNSLWDYSQEIYPLVSYAMVYNKANLWKIRLFMHNETIPEGWSTFFTENRVYDKDWYKQFIKSDKHSLWLRLNTKSYFNNQMADTTDENAFIYFQKIFELNGKYLGILALETIEEDFFSPFLVEYQKYNEVFILYNGRDELYISPDIGNCFKNEKIYKYISANNLFFELDHNLVIFDSNKNLNIEYGIITSITKKQELFNLLAVNSVLVIFALMIPVIIFYLFIRIIFHNITQNIKVMNKVVQGDFSLRIPVKNKNEIGIMAENFNSMIEKINALIKDMVKKGITQKDAQLKALQFQINPHFFYNTLDILGGKMVLAGNFEVAEAIADFGKMLRYNISSKSMNTTVQSEIEHVKNYIRIQKLKYNERIHLAVNIPEDLKDFKIIKFILQPIVENSITHGFKSKEGTLEINMDFSIKNEKEIKIAITDNGSGIDSKALTALNHQMEHSEYLPENDGSHMGIGLENINERLKLFYGEHYFILIESIKGQYTKIILTIPITGNEG